MKNILLLSFDGKSRITYDEKPEFETIVNTWDEHVTSYPHDCLGVFYSPTQRHGEAMYIQGKILKDLGVEYDYVASFCHDLEINVSDINRYFRIAHENQLDCFGPSTSLDSYFSHKEFVHTGTKDALPREWIEIMAIGFSKRLYEKLFLHLEILYGKINLVGGWGLDNILIKKIIKDNHYKCALIDDVQVKHIKKVTRGEIVWRNGKTSRDCMAFYDLYIKYMYTSRFKGFVKKTASKSIGTKPFYNEAGLCTLNMHNQILYVRLTCAKEKDRWPSYRRPNINQILLCGVPDLETDYKLVDDVLYLRCEDTYEFLPTKMIMAYNVILNDIRFKDTTHILKLDNDIDIDQVWEFVNENSELIGTEDYTGGNVYLCALEPGSTWHFGTIPETSYWHNRPFFEKRIPFASGGHTYTLSRRSLEVICKEYNFKNIDEVCKRYILEDMAVALILERSGITPIQNGLKVVNSSFKKRSSIIKKTQLPSTGREASSEGSLKDIKRGSKNLIVQIFFDNKLITNNPRTHTNHNRGPLITARMNDHTVFKDSIEITRKYAERCGADYVLFEKPVINFFSASMERMRIIEEKQWAQKYDNILYIDCDVIIKDDCPNLFELYPQNNLRVCPTLMTKRWLLQKESTIVKRFGDKKVIDNYFNGGVILFHKSTLNLMRGKLKYRERFSTYAFDDQSELNWVVMENNIPMTMMSREYNCKPQTPRGKMIHYLGSLKTKYKRRALTDRLVNKRPYKYQKTNKGGVLVIRYSSPRQKEIWDQVKDIELDELIVCHDQSIDIPYKMVDGVLYVKTSGNDIEYDILRTVSSIGSFKRHYTHFAMIDINKNPDQYFKGVDLEKIKNIHAVGDSLRSKSNSKEPYIISRKGISYYKQVGSSPLAWRGLLYESGIEIFNFNHIKKA